jgi:hypothetical protein
MQLCLQKRVLLHDNGSTVQVYHLANGLSKRVSSSRKQSSFQERKNGKLAMITCVPPLTRAVPRLQRNRYRQWGKKYRYRQLLLYCYEMARLSYTGSWVAG